MSETTERSYAKLTHLSGVAAVPVAIGDAVARGLMVAFLGAGTGEMEAEIPAPWDADEAETFEVRRGESSAASYVVAMIIATGLLSIWVGFRTL